MHQPETRASLILRLKGERNELAWTEFVSTYESFLRQLVGRQGVAERDVADVTQQILAAIAHSVEGWQDDGNPASFRRWLHRVARNVVIKFMARERRHIRGREAAIFVTCSNRFPNRQKKTNSARTSTNWSHGRRGRCTTSSRRLRGKPFGRPWSPAARSATWPRNWVSRREAFTCPAAASWPASESKFARSTMTPRSTSRPRRLQRSITEISRASVMADKRAICDRDLLRKSLDDALSDVQEEELSRHLSECADCQHELERLAAEQGEWSKVGSVLKREAASSSADDAFSRRARRRSTTRSRRTSPSIFSNRPPARGDGPPRGDRHPRGHRPRRHGNRAQGIPARVEAAGCGQSSGAASGRQRRGPPAVRPRGAGGRRHHASERDAHLHRAIDRQAPVPGDAATSPAIRSKNGSPARARSRWPTFSESARRPREGWPPPTHRASCIAT